MTRGHKSSFRFGLFSKKDQALLDLISLEPNQPPQNAFGPDIEQEFVFPERTTRKVQPKTPSEIPVPIEVNADMDARREALKSASKEGFALCEVCMKGYFSQKVKVGADSSKAA